MIDPAELYRIYSTGEVARLLHKSSSGVKFIAAQHGISVPKMGQRGDWAWRAEHIALVKRHTTATK